MSLWHLLTLLVLGAIAGPEPPAADAAWNGRTPALACVDSDCLIVTPGDARRAIPVAAGASAAIVTLASPDASKADLAIEATAGDASTVRRGAPPLRVRVPVPPGADAVDVLVFDPALDDARGTGATRPRDFTVSVRSVGGA